MNYYYYYTEQNFIKIKQYDLKKNIDQFSFNLTQN